MNNNTAEQTVKRTIKDSVFTDFFSIPENLLKLYKVLHPEDRLIGENDLRIITIKNILVDDLYNDLGFKAGNRLIILVEAQSTWTVNIIIRAWLYLATTYQEYIDDNSIDIYHSVKVEIPKPEVYVVYTGDRKIRPAQLTLSEEFFDGMDDLALEVRVKMLYGTDDDDVISQYVSFTKVYDEQRKKYGRTLDAIQETIRICKDKDLLKGYLESREKEVVSMMMTLFDDEQITKNREARITREVTEKVTKSVTKSVTESVTKNVTSKNNVTNIKIIMSKLAYTAEQAMDFLEIPESDRAALVKKI